MIKVKSELKWNVETNTVVFGEKAKLTCKELGNVCTQPRKWIGGKTYNLLCFNNTSTNPSKYQMTSNEQQKTFDLVILHLQYDDIGCDYTCACGFSQYTNKLSLQNFNFIYSSYLDTDVFYINVIIERVYPDPTCRITYISKDNHSIEEIKPIESKLLPDGMMHNITFRESIKTRCLDILKLSCRVRSHTYEVKSWKINNICSDQDGNTYWSAIVVLVVIVVIGIIIKCLLYAKTRSSRSKEYDAKFKHCPSAHDAA